MTSLRDAIEHYIALRRSLGFQLRDAANGLRQFASFMEDKGAAYVTTQLAREWAMLPAHRQPAGWAARLGWVRVFARYRRATDPRIEVPPQGLLPFRPQRAHPYLYSDDEIQKLLEAAKNLSPVDGLRPWSYHCLFGLLAVTGLRIGEARRLKRKDANLQEGLLLIRQTKFNKTRLVPLHASTQQALAVYAERRDRLVPRATADSFFLNDHGRCLESSAVRRTFYDLSHQIGLRGPTDRNGPRIHDFRHRFAVHTLTRWYRSGDDIERRLPVLSTYLGHAHVADTYWYLSVHPELMGLATERLERRWGIS